MVTFSCEHPTFEVKQYTVEQQRTQTNGSAKHTAVIYTTNSVKLSPAHES